MTGREVYVTYIEHTCHLCADCAQVVANGECETPGAEFRYAEGHAALVAENHGNHVQIIVGDHTDDFGTMPCGVCGTLEAGDRWAGEILSYF